MNERKDLTRWNRASLTRFRYVDGKAGEYLDILREQLVDKFKDPETERVEWLSPAVEIPENEKEAEKKNETLLQRQERLSIKQQRILDSYHQDRRDWVWEISRTFARACHILTEHTNAYANENFLGTATEWEHVRRLVAMLDYHPAPPASAFTRLTLIAKPNKSGTVAQGFKVKYSPPAGGAKIIFETLNDITIDAARNELRPMGWNQSEDPVVLEESVEKQTVEVKTYSDLVYEKAIHIRGVKEIGSGDLYDKVFDKEIIELPDIDPDSTGFLSDDTFMLWEWKAKADILIDFSPPGDWSELGSKDLTSIAEDSAESLAKQSGTSLEFATELKLEIEKVEYALEENKFSNSTLQELLRPNKFDSDYVVTGWKAKSEKSPKPGVVAMIAKLKKEKDSQPYIDTANAAMVAGIDSKSQLIRLQPSAVSKDWLKWKKGETQLHISPRWQRECWLNGDDVIRTEEPHGLTADTYIAWKINYTLAVSRNLKSSGRSLVNVAYDTNTKNLSVRIFNEYGDIVIDKTKYVSEKEASEVRNNSMEEYREKLEERQYEEKEDAKKYDRRETKIKNLDNKRESQEAGKELKIDKNLEFFKKYLFDNNALTSLNDALVKLGPSFDISKTLDSEKEIIISNAMSCSGFTPWMHGKIIESDKWSLQLEVKGRLPLPGQELYILRPIDGKVFPENYEAVVIITKDEPVLPTSKKIAPSAEPEENKVELPFCLRKVITSQMTDDSGDAGGGLLPPASLPEIGTFLFPSPMLPMDLVKAAVELLLSFGVMVIPSTGDIVIKGMPFSGMLEGLSIEEAAKALFDMLDKLEGLVQEQNEKCEPYWKLTSTGHDIYEKDKDKNKYYKRDDDGELIPIVSLTTTKVVVWSESITDDASNEEQVKQNAIKAIEEMLSVPEGKEATALFQELLEDITDKGPLLTIPKEPVIKAVVEAIEYQYMFNGSSKIAVGDWVVGNFSDGHRALKVDSIDWFTEVDKTENFALSFYKQNEIKTELKRVYADFRNELMPVDAEINTTELLEEIALEDVPDSLKVGDDILLIAEDKVSVPANIKTIEGNIITTDPSAVGFSKGGLIINGNVVLAGHGETKPEKIIGSGNAAISNQTFILEVVGVSFTHDATKSSGVAAAIEVKVAGRVWEQVSTLKDSAPDDFHYAIRMTEETYVKIIFGDGEHGRRLPSGTNNIRVRYRVGSGLAGIVPAHGLEKPVNPHPLVDVVRQPIKAAGGGDMEDVTSLRENAPPTLLALERAVSLSDFSHLAASQSSIWQAKAFSQILHGGRTESVRVVVVPAGGDSSTDVNEKVLTFLQDHALPGVQVTIADAVKKRFSLLITVRVKSDEFIAEQVVESVEVALLNHFSLQHRKLGQNLYLSEVYKVVEAVLGVENSICELKNATTPQLIRADNESTVVYLDTENGSTLDVIHEVYQP